MRRLTRSSTPDGAVIGASANPGTGMVHLGLGNFHRAHAAVYTAQALAAETGDWGIYGFANRSSEVVAAMRAQDGRYAVLEHSDHGRRAGVVDVHRGLGVLAAEPESFVAAVADPRHRILTLTVSEVGYCRSPRTGALDVGLDDVRRDIADPAHPRSTIGLIARGLAMRAASGAPITVLSCDNLQSNGQATRAVVTEFLHASSASEDVLAFVAEHVSFPNSMVDRIVPATTDQTRVAVAEVLGVDDRCPVPAEDFTMWVLEDTFAAGRPAWERAGAVLSDEVHAYELVKLRLLNGSHSLIAYLGLLDGRATIAEAWAQDFVKDAVRACIAADYLPSITLPRGFDTDGYLESLSHRWANAALGHRTSQVGTDGSVKLLQRIPEPALFALRAGRVPHLLALTVAGWICAVAPPPGFDPGPYAGEIREPARHRLAAATRGTTGPREHALAVLDNGFLPDELTAQPAFGERVAQLVETIARGGITAAAREATSATEDRTTLR
ncbi:fructuronate reductase [Mycolicibacterium canariasense]|uniref:Mannitol-1-phosphate 5-dehydrogenase n=1 Tax=Mycolicibacterium canariasense TaxID=228230 RepID=A0A100WIY8_MYCCR|nr:mannitol dehydrogenase family protein [Mycolicibacterium canariasense]MCV7208297.1 mannitol dehydrogenase family protein [Mycolicibacterium canariasense]ORV09384.1 fructuronate reductase [Mycolicibacterium canariasense]GAS98956.1 fructuronate reductase [Mycolicibacterium canariasense]